MRPQPSERPPGGPGRPDERTDPCDSGEDQDRITQEAHKDDRQYSLTLDALLEDERILRANGDDKAKAGPKARQVRDHPYDGKIQDA